jgi:hypothetical protein
MTADGLFTPIASLRETFTFQPENRSHGTISNANGIPFGRDARSDKPPPAYVVLEIAWVSTQAYSSTPVLGLFAQEDPRRYKCLNL